MIRASGHRVSSSLQTYQSAFGSSLLDREAWNQACWSEVWFTTRSAITRIPRLCASSMSVTASSRVP